MKSKRAKACDISKKVKDAVWERDGECCILCKSRLAKPNAHYISRAQSGLGVEENIVTLCINCHAKLDGAQRDELKPQVREYLESKYPDWNEDNLVYNKWS